jgi:ornithine cyclodeaminase/alanine dehydrogenase-like protein (mu-crystallin family)
MVARRIPPVTSAGILYLDQAAVRAAMPPVGERIELAERAMLALVDDAELPPKIGVHPRPSGSFGHAMPAFLRDPGPPDGMGGQAAGGDLLGLKWVTGFPENAGRGLPAIHATVLVSDPATGQARAILDGAPITADRTAAISGVAMRHWASQPTGRPIRVAIVGAGVQARAHLPVIGHLLPGAELAVFDRHPDRAEAVAEAARGTAGIGAAAAVPERFEATNAADVVITAIAFGPIRQTLTGADLADDGLVIAVDYATSVHHLVALEASLFLVDELGQFAANRDAGQFDDYPDPTSTIGQAIRDGLGPPAAGRTLVSHLGVGLADLVFADAIVRAARDAGLGLRLPR